MNKIGDIGLILAISLICYLFYSLDFLIIQILVPYMQYHQFFFSNYTVNSLFLINCFLFLGVIGKSAQIGLHT
jgi:NADH:ubiquinone oxidoreductase subunit 5 (subunit L)/multisubunit Na+/H+ antiporter MnhA subunit